MFVCIQSSRVTQHNHFCIELCNFLYSLNRQLSAIMKIFEIVKTFDIFTQLKYVCLKEIL